MFKKISNKIWQYKYIGGIILALLSIFSVIYYIISYSKESKLIFTEEHKVLLIAIGTIFILVAILYISMIIMYNKLKNQNNQTQDKLNNIYSMLCDLFNHSIDCEDNIIKVNRSESMNIVKMVKGALDNEKDSRV